MSILDQATQATAATAEETAAAAEQLNQHALTLESAVCALSMITERRARRRTGQWLPGTQSDGEDAAKRRRREPDQVRPDPVTVK